MNFFKGFRKQFVISFIFILLLIFIYNFYVFIGITKIEIATDSLDVVKIQEQTAFLKDFSFWILLAAVIFVFGIIINIILNLTFSLKEILDGIEEIKLGNLEYRIPLKVNNEFGDIASFFNEAIKNLKDFKIKLREKEISEAEILQEMNKSLQREIIIQTNQLISQLKEKTNELEEIKKQIKEKC